MLSADETFAVGTDGSTSLRYAITSHYDENVDGCAYLLRATNGEDLPDLVLMDDEGRLINRESQGVWAIVEDTGTGIVRTHRVLRVFLAMLGHSSRLLLFWPLLARVRSQPLNLGWQHPSC